MSTIHVHAQVSTEELLQAVEKLSATDFDQFISEVLRLQSQRASKNGGTPKPIEEELDDLAAQVPAEAWKNLPPDLTTHLDHYLYG